MASTEIAGVLNINKPLGPTSFDVVARLRLITRLRKIGHGGTLDPLASGVLPICIGRATRLVEYLSEDDKAYRAMIELGVTTTTDDKEGEVVTTQPVTVTRAQFESALAKFLGEVEQVPPIYSAIKHDGKHLYDLARQGKAVTVEARTVRFDRLEVVTWAPRLVQIDVVCSKGTYIRALARDLGATLGCGAHLAGLIRTKSGAFTLSDATTLNEIEAARDWTTYLRPIDFALSHLPEIIVDEDAARALINGMAVEADAPKSPAPTRAYAAPHRFIGVVKYDEATSQWRPNKIFV